MLLLGNNGDLAVREADKGIGRKNVRRHPDTPGQSLGHLLDPGRYCGALSHGVLELSSPHGTSGDKGNDRRHQ